jgi:hypothetical protein
MEQLIEQSGLERTFVRARMFAGNAGHFLGTADSRWRRDSLAAPESPFARWRLSPVSRPVASAAAALCRGHLVAPHGLSRHAPAAEASPDPAWPTAQASPARGGHPDALAWRCDRRGARKRNTDRVVPRVSLSPLDSGEPRHYPSSIAPDVRRHFDSQVAESRDKTSRRPMATLRPPSRLTPPAIQVSISQRSSKRSPTRVW